MSQVKVWQDFTSVKLPLPLYMFFVSLFCFVVCFRMEKVIPNISLSSLIFLTIFLLLLFYFFYCPVVIHSWSSFPSHSSSSYSSSPLSPRVCSHQHTPLPRGSRLWGQTRQSLCICVWVGLRPAPVCYLVGVSVYEKSQGSRLVETTGLLWGHPSP